MCAVWFSTGVSLTFSNQLKKIRLLQITDKPSGVILDLHLSGQNQRWVESPNTVKRTGKRSGQQQGMNLDRKSVV